MKAIVLMFDSLNRRQLPAYGGTVPTPHFDRLAARARTLDTAYVASMPCMPARRDLLTGRPGFLHRGWGPIEPYDDCFTTHLSAAGVSTHLLTDHYHYWEDGGATYHPRYDTAQFFRGQEGDPWIGQSAPPAIPAHLNGKGRRQDWVNRQFMQRLADFPQSQTVAAGLDFIHRNATPDASWYLQLELFDPHEPFVSHPDFQTGLGLDPEAPLFDWPPYAPVTESPELIAQARARYTALLRQCDASLGAVLDAMDQHQLWQDTLLIVWTDHGYLLAEHGQWAKNHAPLYEEVARTPCFIHDPRHPGPARLKALVQPALDLAPTLLGYFGLPPGPHMLGHDLAPVLANDTPIRTHALFGYHGQEVNLTDGRHVYFRAAVTADNQPLYQHTLMPAQMRGFYPAAQLQQAELHPGFTFTQGIPLLRVPWALSHFATGGPGQHRLYDLAHDPSQQSPCHAPSTEADLIEALRTLLREVDAPPSQYKRLGLT